MKERNKNKILLLPLLFLIILTSFLFIFLLSEKDPSKPPSALINQELPNFTAKDLYNEEINLTNKEIMGKQILINFFASWCLPCKAEHEFFYLIKEADPDLYIIGFNHKDKKEDAIKFLKENGNPYNFTGVDSNGAIALEFGVFGLPETFLTNKEGNIIFKNTGPLTKKIIKNEIIPLLH